MVSLQTRSRASSIRKSTDTSQFTPVANGWIDKPADTDSINAAKEALNGVDPTNGALWYYDDSTTNEFMLAKKVAIKIGHMVFAY